ncbi:MAG: chorismate lyase [Idiomarina sp.]|nr:chorismate lyase [Idiomarina sp.]
MTSSILTDTNWLCAEQALREWHLPPLLQDWLLDPGSLTTRLQAASSDFNVQVLRHDTGSVSHDELHMMQRVPQLPCQVREVLLREQTTPWVFARSVIPQSPHGLLHELQNIGSNPLGQALFTHADVSPGDFEFALFEPASAMGRLNTTLSGHSHAIYARRRIFWVEDAPVLVAEVFLSDAPCYNLISKNKKEFT